jgi:uncharacterized repeat protein (TIGR01451 family)
MKRAGTVSKGSLRWGLTFLLFFIFSARVFAQTCVQPPPGIVAWWPFDETSGPTAEDIVGSNPGVQTNGPLVTPGQVGNALRFDGVDDYVGVGDSDLWAFGANDFTIELWANWDSPGSGDIVHAGDVLIGNDEGPGSQNKWFFALGGGLLHFTVYNEFDPPPNVYLVRAPFSPTVGQWYHLAITKHGTLFTIYVDGIPIGSEVSTSPIANPDAPLLIGQSNEPFGGFMNGLLDEVAIYNRALTQQELQTIANAGGNGKCKELTIATRSVPAVKLEENVSFRFQAKFGIPPFSWSVTNGTLPTGLSLNPDGSLSGTPTQPGTFSFTVKVTDSNNDTAEKSFTQDVVLILPPPTISIHKTGTVAVPGRTLEYFIVVENTGVVEATDVVIEEHLMSPDFKTNVFVVVSSTPEADFVEDGFILVWVVPSLGPGERQLLSYKVSLNPSVTLGTPVVGGACRDGDGDPNLSAMQGRMSAVGEQCRLCVNVCRMSYCDGLDECVKDCNRLPWPLKKICISGCGIAFSQCAGCLKGCADVCTTECSAGSLQATTSSTCQACPDGCACNEQDATGPVDPNEKLVVAKNCSRDPGDDTITCFVHPDQLLVYPIHFENIGEVEALDVFVTDVLDPNLDTSTLSILTPDGASFDVMTNTLKWSLLGRNLQPHETDNVLLSIRPKSNLPSGTKIRNKATIQFEIFESLDTNEVVNVIDNTRPTCMVNPLPTTTPTLSFPISWSGADAVGEIESYSILMSVNGGSFSPFLEKTSDTSVSFTGELGKTYGFLCVATDTAGNIEVQDPVAETATTLILPADLTLKKGTLLLDPDPDADKLTLQGTFAGSATSINPPAEGVKITLTDADGQIVALDFPAGALWKTNQGPRWSFRDPTAGKTLTFQFNAKTGTFSLRVNVKKVNLNDPDPGAITTSVMIGDKVFQNVQVWRSTAKGKKLVTP